MDLVRFVLWFIIDSRKSGYVGFVLRAHSVSLTDLDLYLLLLTLVRVHFGVCAIFRFLPVFPAVFIARGFCLVYRRSRFVSFGSFLANIALLGHCGAYDSCL